MVGVVPILYPSLRAQAFQLLTVRGCRKPFCIGPQPHYLSCGSRCPMQACLRDHLESMPAQVPPRFYPTRHGGVAAQTLARPKRSPSPPAAIPLLSSEARQPPAPLWCSPRRLSLRARMKSLCIVARRLASRRAEKRCRFYSWI